MTSDASVAAAGFSAVYTTPSYDLEQRQIAEGATASPDGMMTNPPAPPVCTGTLVLRAASGTLSDGFGNYANSADCQWLV